MTDNQNEARKLEERALAALATVEEQEPPSEDTERNEPLYLQHAALIITRLQALGIKTTFKDVHETTMRGNVFPAVDLDGVLFTVDPVTVAVGVGFECDACGVLSVRPVETLEDYGRALLDGYACHQCGALLTLKPTGDASAS